MATSSDDKKTMDVAKPGNVAADASARPVIVTHRPMVKDPMVKSDDDVSELEPTEETAKDAKSAPTSGEKVIQPINKDIAADTNEIEKAAAAAIASKQKEPATLATKEPKKEEPQETAPNDVDTKSSATKESTDADQKTETNETNITSSSDAAVVDAIADQAGSNKHKEKQEAEQDAAIREHIQKLIDEKKYFVKTGQVARRRNNRIALVFLVLIVLAVGLYMAVDAKLIDVGFDVPVQVINN